MRISEIVDVFKWRRTIIMDEKDVTKVISIVNRYADIKCDNGLYVASCGWEDDPGKWFILFYSINKDWQKIKEELVYIDSVEIEE